jgi:ribosome maturation factor RimP
MESALELVDVEYKQEGANWYLRLYIDKQGGVQVDDCTKISQFLNTRLDNCDFIIQSYILEVSSPGIERVLKKPADFTRYQGSEVTLRTMTKIDGQKHFQGKLSGYQDGQVLLETETGVVQIPLEQVTKAKLKVF